MVAILNDIFMKSTDSLHKEMQRKFHVWRQNKEEIGARGIVQVILGCLPDRKSVVVLGTAQNAEHSSQPVHSENRRLGNWNRKCHWRDTRKWLPTALQDIWSYPKHPLRHLVDTKRSVKFCPVKNVHPYKDIPEFKQPITFIFPFGLQD